MRRFAIAPVPAAVLIAPSASDIGWGVTSPAGRRGARMAA